MADFKFNCPHCKQSLEAPDEMLGQQINCPSCNGAIDLPAPVPRQSAPPPPPQQPTTRACPFCGEQILTSAIKCKHCGEFLDGRGRQSTTPKPKKTGVLVENEIWKGPPSYLYYLGHFIFGVLLLPLFGLGLLIIILALLDRNTRIYTLTNKRVMSKAGIISRQVHEVGIRDIRAINVKQGILERIFGLGTVEVGSAGTAGIEVTFVGITSPVSVRDMIRRQKDETEGND